MKVTNGRDIGFDEISGEYEGEVSEICDGILRFSVEVVDCDVASFHKCADFSASNEVAAFKKEGD